jgi:hypothetical protein
MNNEDSKSAFERRLAELKNVAIKAGYQKDQYPPEIRGEIQKFAEDLVRCPDDAEAEKTIRRYCSPEKDRAFVVGLFLNFTQQVMPALKERKTSNTGPYSQLAEAVIEYIVQESKKRT